MPDGRINHTDPGRPDFTPGMEDFDDDDMARYLALIPAGFTSHQATAVSRLLKEMLGPPTPPPAP